MRRLFLPLMLIRLRLDRAEKQLKTYILVMFILIAVCAVLLVILNASNRKNIRQMQRLLDEWQMQNKYMDNTVSLCTETVKLTDEVRNSIESACIDREKLCLNKCDRILSDTNGADTALGVLLFEKKQICFEKDIEFFDEATFLPDENQIDEIDSVSVIGNLLDNAIEALEASDMERKDKYIRFISSRKKNVWIVRVINPLDDKKIIDKNLNTSKTDKINHGLGMSIVRMLISRYSGEIKITNKGRCFEVSAYLVIKRRGRR